MPEMTLLGWFHTVLGVLALIIAFYTLIKYKIISLVQFSGKLYLLLTVIVAASALGIYNQGGSGVAHMLAVLTLAALAGGVIMEKVKLQEEVLKDKNQDLVLQLRVLRVVKCLCIEGCLKEDLIQ